MAGQPAGRQGCIITLPWLLELTLSTLSLPLPMAPALELILSTLYLPLPTAPPVGLIMSDLLLPLPAANGQDYNVILLGS